MYVAILWWRYGIPEYPFLMKLRTSVLEMSTHTISLSIVFMFCGIWSGTLTPGFLIAKKFADDQSALPLTHFVLISHKRSEPIKK